MTTTTNALAKVDTLHRAASSLSSDLDGAGADLAELLAAVATAWTETTHQPITVGEQLRWSPVCITATRIATRWAARQ